MLRSLVLVLLILPTLALADVGVRVEFGGWSRHFSAFSKNVTNETHQILAVEYRGFGIGRFENSFGRNTLFVSKIWRQHSVMGLKNLNAVASLGLSKGYRVCYGDDSSQSNICPHGYIGLEYIQGFFYHAMKFQPAVVVYNMGVEF